MAPIIRPLTTKTLHNRNKIFDVNIAWQTQPPGARLSHLPISGGAAINAIHIKPELLASALLCLLMLLPRPAVGQPSFELRCERDMRPRLDVLAHKPGFTVNNRLSSRTLHSTSKHAYSSDMMLGMTATSTRTEIDIDGPALSDPSGQRECIAPRISVQISYQPLDVFVARELHPASCPYRTVFEHEMQHVKIYVDNLPRIERLVREELAKRFTGPLYAPARKGLAQLRDQVDTWLMPLIKAELAMVEAKQVALDSLDETERLSRACLGEVEKVMGSRY